jgi:malate synthase
MIQGTSERIVDETINRAPIGFDLERDLAEGFAEFFVGLHKRFTPLQRELAFKRTRVLRSAHDGILPDYKAEDAKSAGDWKIALPSWCQDQRNQMTGPADDGALVVKMLNSGAPGVMIDIEDSMANRWENLELGIKNAIDALHGTLIYDDQKRDKEVSIEESETVIWTRVRGIHLNQAGILENELVSASVFDVARIAFGVDKSKLKHNLCFYIPKTESAEEGLFWRDLFEAVENKLGWEKGYIKCMALVEAHPFAFQTEEFIYNLRDHILGLNLGRWDYMASLIHFNLEDKNWVLPDRNTIPSDVAFFQNLREQLVEVCHKHGLLAIGGMTALYPSRVDVSLNERALKILAVDKKNEAGVGMDGAWTGHPDQNAIAVAQFPSPNQISIRKSEIGTRPDLRPVPTGVGKHTLDGTRAAIRTVIRYRHGVLSGRGASLLDGYMEDLATDRIYRLMIAQRIKHRDQVTITDGAESVVHTPEFVTQIFDEELKRIVDDLPEEDRRTEAARYTDARWISEEMIKNGRFDPI